MCVHTAMYLMKSFYAFIFYSFAVAHFGMSFTARVCVRKGIAKDCSLLPNSSPHEVIQSKGNL